MQDSLSTFLLGGAAALALSALLILIPWNSIQALIDGQGTMVDFCFLFLFSGSPILVGLFMYAASLIRKHRQAHVRRGTQRLAWNKLHDQDLVHKLRTSFPILDSVSLRIRGNADRAHDPGGRLHVSPRCYLVQGHRTIVFPAVLWKRLQHTSSALGAVIAHEMAHFQHRDIEWLSWARRLLWGVTVVFLANYLFSMYTSIQADMAAASIALDWATVQAVQASLAGKAFHLSALVALAIFAVYIRVLARWREALADSAAIDCLGETALWRAKLLITDTIDAFSDFQVKHLGHVKRKASTLLTPFHWLLLGGVIVAVSTYLVGPLAYLKNHGWFVEDGPEYARWIGWSIEILVILLPYAGFLTLLEAVREHAGPERGRRSSSQTLANAALCLVVGGSIGFVLAQSLPLTLSSIFMPDGYNNFFRYQPGPHFMSSILGQLGHNAWYVVLALLGVAAAQALGSAFLSWLPGMLWAVVSLAERECFPLLMEGWLAPLAVGVFAFLVLALALGHKRKIVRGDASWLPVFFLASLYWAGLGDFNHLAVASAKAAVKAEERSDSARSIMLYRKVVFHAPGQGEPREELARAIRRLVGNLDEAIAMAETAIDAPLTSSWIARFSALKLAGDLRLERRKSSDLTRAIHWYSKAEWFWRNNSRLAKDVVADMLYNQACAAVLRGGPSREVVSGLLEALSLKPALAVHMLLDPDLAALNLMTLPPPTAQLIAEMADVKHLNFERRRISKFAMERKIGVEELASVLAHLARIASLTRRGQTLSPLAPSVGK